MLAFVKTPHTELSINGEGALDVLKLIKSKFDVRVVEDEDDDEFVNIFETDFWKRATPGDLLAGCRLKHEMTQKQVAKKAGVPQSVISDYENGRRKLTRKAAVKFAKVFDEDPDSFFP